MHSNTMKCYSKVSLQLDKRSSWARKCFLAQCTSKNWKLEPLFAGVPISRTHSGRELPLATSSARQAAEVVKILGSAKARSWDVLCALGAPQVGRVQTVARRGPEWKWSKKTWLIFCLIWWSGHADTMGFILDECVVIFMQRLCSAFARLGR